MRVVEEFESEKEHNAKIGEMDVNDPKHIYCDDTSRQDHPTYNLSPIKFEGSSGIVNF